MRVHEGTLQILDILPTGFLRPYHLLMKCFTKILAAVLFLLVSSGTAAQTRFLAQAPPEQRLPLLWQYCSNNLISDQDSAVTHRFLAAVAHTADSLGDERLKSYAQYFRICYRVLFSSQYEQYFPQGDYRQVVRVFARAQNWAQQNGYSDIAAACEHYIGKVYFQAAQYGLAFEHLLKANAAFRKIGYENVPAISIYLHNLGLDYYWFEEYDKALEAFLAASRYPFFIARPELNTLNSIGLIYARQQNWDKAVAYYRKTIARAKEYNDVVWIGIASGNLGNVFLAKEQNDSALFYHIKNYNINAYSHAPEDAAKSALAVATVFIRQQQPDTAWYYIRAGQALARKSISDPAERLEYRRRLLEAILGWHKLKENYKTALLFSDSLAADKEPAAYKHNGK